MDNFLLCSGLVAIAGLLFGASLTLYWRALALNETTRAYLLYSGKGIE